MNRYHFSTDWFSYNIPTWERHLAAVRGRSGLRYLEVGVYEGRSLFWMMNHVLTAPDARATAVDAFFPHAHDYEASLRDNLARCDARDKIAVLKGDSADVLRSLPLGSFDVIYIDAGHGQRALFVDLALCWGLLAAGGLMILDDYKFGHARLPYELRPQPVIDVFLDAVALEVEVVHRDYQIILKRAPLRVASAGRQQPPEHIETCTQLGDWFYFWESGQLLRADGSNEDRVPSWLLPVFKHAWLLRRKPLLGVYEQLTKGLRKLRVELRLSNRVLAGVNRLRGPRH